MFTLLVPEDPGEITALLSSSITSADFLQTNSLKVLSILLPSWVCLASHINSFLANNDLRRLIAGEISDV